MNFQEYLLSGFGSGICEIFLFPYNEKMLAASLDGISPDAANRFFPSSDEKIIEEGSRRGRKIPPPGYNSWFWYPKFHGIGLLAKGLADGLDHLWTCCRVEKVDLDNKCLVTSRGRIRYTRLMTSTPLKTFCSLTDDRKLRTLAKKLSHNQVLCINLLVPKKNKKMIEGRHWIYVPDQSIPFYRLGVYSHLPLNCAPAGYSSVYMEVSFGSGGRPGISEVLKKAFQSLEKTGWFEGRDCQVIAAHWIDCAYVHFTPDREKAVAGIREILRAKGVHPIGRYGLWDYLSMEDSIYSGIETAGLIAS